VDSRAWEGGEAHGKTPDAVDDGHKAEEVSPTLVSPCTVEVEDAVREEEEGRQGGENVGDAVVRGIVRDLGEGMESQVVEAGPRLVEIARDIG